MLKISIESDGHKATLKLEGRVAGPWATELKRCWRHLWAPAKDGKFLLDLRGLTFADQAGTQILREIVRTTRAEVLADSPLTRYFAWLAKCNAMPGPTEEDDNDNGAQIESELGL